MRLVGFLTGSLAVCVQMCCLCIMPVVSKSGKQRKRQAGWFDNEGLFAILLCKHLHQVHGLLG